MVRKVVFLALLLMTGGLILSSCTKEEELSSKKEILSFVFEASKNTELEQNIIGSVTGTEVALDVPFGTGISQLIPTIEVSPGAVISPASGVATSFADPVTYTVTAEDGSTKQFSTAVAVAPAPYIGVWKSGPIDFGVGLVHLMLTIEENGATTLEMQEIVTREISTSSLKGVFDPLGKPNTDIHFQQTHRWINHSWREEAHERTIMYHFEDAPKMKFFYCICHPRSEWWFQVELTKQ